MVEALKSFDQEGLNINSLERKNESISYENDRVLNRLNNLHLGDIHSLVDTLSANNPDFKKELETFQDKNSTMVEAMLKSTSETHDIKTSSFEYFNIDKKEISEIQNELLVLNLDINSMLEGYENFIENNLNGLTELQIEKVKLSIKNKILSLGELIIDLKGNLEKGEDFKNNRWIVNDKIQDSFSDVNNKILPSLEYLSKLQLGEKVTEKENLLYDINSKKREIQGMMDSDILTNGDFDKTWTSGEVIDANTNNWNILDAQDDKDLEFLNSKGIKGVDDISLLNEKDIKIQQEAMISFFILIGVQMIPYVGAPISIGVDSRDIVSNEDATIELGKKLGMIDESFKIDKQWYDNVLGGVGLALTVVGLQGIAKGEKISDSVNSLRKIGFGRIKESLIKFGDKLGINKDKLDYVLDGLRKLFGGEVDDIKKENGNILSNNIEGKIFLESKQLSEKEVLLINEGKEIHKKIEFISRNKDELFKILNTTRGTINEKKLLERYSELDSIHINLLKREKEISRVLDGTKIEDAKVFVEGKLGNPLLEDILIKFIDDSDNSMNITDYLKDINKRDKVIDEINNLLASGLVGKEDFIRVIKNSETFNSPLLKGKNFNNNIDLSKKLELNNVQLFKGYNFNDIRDVIRLDEHIINIKLNVLNKLDTDLRNILFDANVDGIHISSRVKSKDGVVDKIKRMREGNNGKNPRPDYVLSSVPDIIGGRIIVKDITDLEKVMIKLENMYGEGKIFEKDNFYINENKKYRPYRLITYTVEISNTPVEIQLVSFIQNIVADIDHNLLYKPIINSTNAQKELVKGITNTATANETLKLK